MKNLAFIAYSNERGLYYQFSLPPSYMILFIRMGECTFWTWEWKGSSISLTPSSKYTLSQRSMYKWGGANWYTKIIFHLSKLWKAKFFILCDVVFLVRLQGKFEIDHSRECTCKWTAYRVVVPGKNKRTIRSNFSELRPILADGTNFGCTVNTSTLRMRAGHPSEVGSGCCHWSFCSESQSESWMHNNDVNDVLLLQIFLYRTCIYVSSNPTQPQTKLCALLSRFCFLQVV